MITPREQLLMDGTPVEDYTREFGLWIKREDLSARAPGPAFSKTRGVFAHLAARPETTIGVLDTYHSQAGHAVAHAAAMLGKQVINYYPEFKHEKGPREPQLRARALGALLLGLPAGRSSILFHQAKRDLQVRFPGAYMMPNALKLPEMVAETAREVGRLDNDEHYDTVIIPASSATIAAGVIKGFHIYDAEFLPRFIVHLGYSRSKDAVMEYILDKLDSAPGSYNWRIDIIDEDYGYRDKAKDGPTPPWPCNPYYDLKAFRWWMRERAIDGGATSGTGETLFWNIG